MHSPQTPEFWWGNLLVFDEAPGPGDGERWERRFDAEFGADPRIRHRTFAWDQTDGRVGAAEIEFVARGYKLEHTAGLIATPQTIRHHRRENLAVEVRMLNPQPGVDERLWDEVRLLQAATARRHPEDYGDELTGYSRFAANRQRALRQMFRAGRGGWFVALDGGSVVGSLGVVVTDRRARFQAVDTLESHRRRGIASRLVATAGEMAAAAQPIDHLVIAADPDYHAIGIYEDLGFERVEAVVGALLTPDPD